LREVASKVLSGEGAVTAEVVQEKINKTQQVLLGLFQKVYEQRNDADSANPSESETLKEEKKD
jgi:molecular chaperone DnaK